jgi:hypothetical protein
MAQLLRRAGLVRIRQRRVAHPASIPAPQWCRTLVGNRVRALLGRRQSPLYFFRDHLLHLARKPGGG